MRETLKVMVPVDFSEASRRALAWAFDYATRAPVELHLIHVVEDRIGDVPARERYDAEVRAIMEQAESELRRMVPDTKERERLGTIAEHVVRGSAAAEILRLAKKLEAEMIVMGSRGRSALAELLLGSVADKVVRAAKCPVVIVRA
jgi:universal stress protein A